MAPIMAKPVMLPQSQGHRPDPHRPALRSDGLVRIGVQQLSFSSEELMQNAGPF